MGRWIVRESREELHRDLAAEAINLVALKGIVDILRSVPALEGKLRLDRIDKFITHEEGLRGAIVGAPAVEE